MLPQKIFVKQKVKLVETITDIETKNKYLILDENKNKLFYAYEDSNPVLRVFLRQLRPLKLKISYFNDVSNSVKASAEDFFLEVEKKFAVFLPKFYIYNNGEKIGFIRNKFSFSHRLLYVYDNNGQLVFFTKTSILHPWTFKIYSNEQEYDVNFKNEEVELASILRKWSGFKEFVDGNTFFVDFKSLDDSNKKLILALAFVIDLLFFEK